MKLSYRGVQYDYEPALLEVRESQSSGFYRGRRLNFPYASHLHAPQPVSNLTYRGMGYDTTAEGIRTSFPLTVEPQSPVSMPGQSVGLMGRQARLNLLRQATEVHRTNIERSLNHRIAIARAAGDKRLVQMLEDEFHQLV